MKNWVIEKKKKILIPFPKLRKKNLEVEENSFWLQSYFSKMFSMPKA